MSSLTRLCLCGCFTISFKRFDSANGVFSLFLCYQMAEEISKPLCEARKVTMVSSGDGQVGAAKLSGEVLDMMTRIPEALEKLTGVSISQVTHLCVHILYRVYQFFVPFDLPPISCAGELRYRRPCWIVVTRPTHLLAAPWTSCLTDITNTSSSSSLTSPVYLCYLPVIVVDTNFIFLSLFCL